MFESLGLCQLADGLQDTRFPVKSESVKKIPNENSISKMCISLRFLDQWGSERIFAANSFAMICTALVEL